jgi:hypothetical protein
MIQVAEVHVNEPPGVLMDWRLPVFSKKNKAGGSDTPFVP